VDERREIPGRDVHIEALKCEHFHFFRKCPAIGGR
jgi:hypothetical protein